MGKFEVFAVFCIEGTKGIPPRSNLRDVLLASESSGAGVVTGRGVINAVLGESLRERAATNAGHRIDKKRAGARPTKGPAV